MNLPNKLTLLRVVLVPIFMAFIMIDATWAKIAGLVIFAVASLTDALDGHIARSQNLVTTFGKFADPLADKMLTTAALLVFTYQQIISPWVLMIVLGREFAVAGIRLVAAADGNVIAASFWGKFKTVSQMIAIIAGLLLMCISIIPVNVANTITSMLIWISVIFTLISGVEYIWKNRKLLSFK